MRMAEKVRLDAWPGETKGVYCKVSAWYALELQLVHDERALSGHKTSRSMVEPVQAQDDTHTHRHLSDTPHRYEGWRFRAFDPARGKLRALVAMGGAR